MSYAMAGALQAAVYQRLQNDAALSALVGSHVYDALPSGRVPDLFVSLGPEDVRDASDSTGAAADHRFIVSVISDEDGFFDAKAAAGAVSDALVDASLTLSRGRLVGLWFERAKAARAGKAGRLRRIDLRFRARVEDV